MLLSFVDNFCATAHNHVLQLAPVFTVLIHKQGHVGVLNDIQDPPQLSGARSLWFFIDLAID
jgi:hypothetical protein